MVRYNNQYPNIFQPIQVGPIKLKNRIIWTPMVSCLSTAEGEVNGEFVNFIAMEAKTGVSMLTIGATSVDEINGIDYPGELLITRDSHIGRLARIADAAHRSGAKISVEMCHAGRAADPTMAQTDYAIAPTSLPLAGKLKHVKEMDQSDIDRVIECYASCTERLKKADFDMVMVHAAHGNLIGQFLSPLTNHRVDDYGGSPEKRWRFALEVCKAVREAAGKDMAVEMRISGDERHPDGMRIEDTLAFLKEAQQYIDMVQMSQGLIVDPGYSFYVMPPYYNPYFTNLEYAEAAHEVLDIPVTAFGAIKTLDNAEKILADGKADIVGLGRPFLADHKLIKNAREGHPERTRPCIRCEQACGGTTSKGKVIHCVVNPRVSFESQYGNDLQPALVKKKAVVVGGGPAGMMATQTLIERGHSVVLFEASDRIGGRLPDICLLPFRDDLKQYTEWDIRTTLESGADIRLNTKAGADEILAEDPDILVLATGSLLAKPDIPGIDGENVLDVVSVDNGSAKTGQKVVVCGGGMSGLECALALAMEGKDVTVVDQIPVDDFAKEIVYFTRNMLFMNLRKYGVKLVDNKKVTAIDDKGVHTMDRDWEEGFIEADTVVTAFGLVPNDEGLDELSNLIAETYIVGDCEGNEMSLYNANFNAFHYLVEA